MVFDGFMAPPRSVFAPRARSWIWLFSALPWVCRAALGLLDCHSWVCLVVCFACNPRLTTTSRNYNNLRGQKRCVRAFLTTNFAVRKHYFRYCLATTPHTKKSTDYKWTLLVMAGISGGPGATVLKLLATSTT